MVMANFGILLRDENSEVRHPAVFKELEFFCLNQYITLEILFLQ